MAKYKYKIAEAKETLKATEVDPALIQRIEKTYGPVDMVNDFFSSDLKTYFKATDVDPETGAVDSQVIKLASFTDSLEKLYTATTMIRPGQKALLLGRLLLPWLAMQLLAKLLELLNFYYLMQMPGPPEALTTSMVA